jgi:hypothetical protein
MPFDSSASLLVILFVFAKIFLFPFLFARNQDKLCHLHLPGFIRKQKKDNP